MEQTAGTSRLNGMSTTSFKQIVILSLAGLFIIGTNPGWADNPNVYSNTPDNTLIPDNSAATPSPDASTPPPDASVNAAQEAALTPDQLDSLVAPIALYPDTLVSQILVASTYPLEIVQAAQWLDQNASLKGADLTKAAQAQNWDASIQALVVFPDVIKRLSQDVTWTTNVGNAFLARQADVMDSVQRMRLKAEQAGKLKSTPQEKVTTTTDQGQQVVEIAPANPEVVYVPYYDPTLIWGPPAYYAYPDWGYDDRPYAGAYCWFGSGISLSFYYGAGWRGYGGGWGWSPRWHDHAVFVNNTFIQHNNYHAGGVVAHGAGPAVWHHDTAHRMGVAYPNRGMAQQYHPAMYARPTVAQTQAQFHAAAVRSSAVHYNNAGAGDRFGHRNIAATSYGRSPSAFGGASASGVRTQAYSQRGNTSLSHIARPSGAGGGVHSAGGGAHTSGGAHMSGGGGGHSSGGGGGGHER
jgi:hypothetical protein